MASFKNHPDWAHLPEHILDSIAIKLIPPLAYYIRFTAVCKTWYAAATGNHKLHNTIMKSLDPNFPLLMVPTEDKSEEKRSLYSITQRKILDFQLSVPYKRRCCGSSHGWLAISDKNSAVTLINPFTGGVIHLPPVTPAIVFDENEEYENYICKVILSGDLSLSPDKYVVVALLAPSRSIAIIRPGDEAWTYTQSNTEKVPFCDVIFHKGQIYAVNWLNGIISVDVTSTPSGIQPQEEMVIPPMSNDDYKTSYIVESSGGDLLVVERKYKKSDQWPSMTSSFKVYKLLKHPNQPKLVELKNLGDDALFLGDNKSISVATSDFPGCQPNCIYYTDDNIDFPGAIKSQYGPCDIGIFNLEDESFELHYTPDPSHKEMPTPIWIMPSLPEDSV